MCTWVRYFSPFFTGAFLEIEENNTSTIEPGRSVSVLGSHYAALFPIVSILRMNWRRIRSRATRKSSMSLMWQFNHFRVK